MHTAQKTYAGGPTTGPEVSRTARKTYFVNPRLQWQLVLGANVLALISVAMLITLWYYTQVHLHTFATIINLPQSHPFMEQIAASEAKFIKLCVLIGAVQFLLFNVTAVFLSHRIAGPLYRLEHHLEDVGNGNEPRDVKFRKGDLYQELATASNKVMARMRDSTSARTR